MVDLSVALRVKLDDKAAAKLAFSLRHAAIKQSLAAEEAVFSELLEILSALRGCLKTTELLKDTFLISFRVEGDLEALVVSLSEDGGELSLGDRNLLLIET